MELFELEQKLSEVQNSLVNCYTTLDEIWMFHPANPDFVNPIKMYDDLKKSITNLEMKYVDLEMKISHVKSTN
jgi:uncharacterized coiled-coil DUF342 family protein